MYEFIYSHGKAMAVMPSDQTLYWFDHDGEPVPISESRLHELIIDDFDPDSFVSPFCFLRVVNGLIGMVEGYLIDHTTLVELLPNVYRVSTDLSKEVFLGLDLARETLADGLPRPAQ